MPLTATSETRATVGRALAVAGGLRADPDVIFVRPDPEVTFASTGLEPAGFDVATRGVCDTVDRHGRPSQERARRQVHAACESAEVPRSRSGTEGETASARWHVVKGEPALAVPKIARCADPAIFSGVPAHCNLSFGNVPEATPVKSGTPVLVLPESLPARALDHAIPVSDGGTSCAGALSAWLSSGPATGATTVLHVSERQKEPPNREPLRTGPSRHGIEAAVRVCAKGPVPVGEGLLAAAGGSEAGLIVLGGYGKSRDREAVFGGVTRHVIRPADIPVLPTH